MITLSSIIQRAREAYKGQVELRYVHPTLYLVCKDAKFSGLDDGDRRHAFLQKLGLNEGGVELNNLASVLSLVLVTSDERERDYDFLDTPNAGQHWLPLFDPAALAEAKPVESALPRAVHFYGYKGGQARSTVLAMFAQYLANDGYKVLAIDADVEAPSLDVLFNSAATSISQTLLRFTTPAEPFNTLSAYTALGGGGRIDFLACRPTGSEYDMDFAAFALRTALDVTILEEGLKSLRQHVTDMDSNDRYDVVLFDHRSGLTSSVLPIIAAYPGPTVLCLRIDEQSNAARRIFNVLLRSVRDVPGAYVSFSLDPEDTREKILGRYGAKINELLDDLGEAIERGSTDYVSPNEDLPPEDFQRYWVSWFHDRAFLLRSLPKIEEISSANRQSLLQLREVLGFSGKKVTIRPRTRRRPLQKLSPSGAGDEGIFIETQEIARLFQNNTTVTYIFGRKGTGKTRLLRELQARGQGDPLVVAADFKGAGLPSGDALFTDLASVYAADPEKLWWSILDAALDSDDTLGKEFREELNKRSRQESSTFRISTIAAKAAKLDGRQRVFLMDGIETAFRAAQLMEFVEGLFKFLLTVQSDSQFADRIVIRLFLRTDLARRAIQNVEQQTNGRRLDLVWNTQSIFNFVLSRIGQLDWFRTNFPDPCRTIATQIDQIRAGLLPAEDYESILLEIFPRHLRRNNLQTLTFLKTYFSDAAGDNELRAAFYPRLFDTFLHAIAHPEELPHGSVPANAIEDGRVHQALILAAHETASRTFLEEVKQELTVLLNLSDQTAENERRVSQLLAAFEGLSTPFALEARLEELVDRLQEIPAARLREALQRMKDIGMFEDRPGYQGWWRAGRLFKSALRMKYVR